MNNTNIDYRLYLVTDRNLIGSRDFYNCIEEAILGGVSLIQLREKEVSTGQFYKIAVKLKELTSKYNIPLIINDRLDIALAIDADGLHIGQSDMPLYKARKILGENKIIGVSASNLEQALEAERGQANYIGVGAVFSTSTKLDAKSVSLEELRKIKSSIKIPVVAIGGINERNAEKTMKTDVDGIAVVSAILGKKDIKEASEKLFDLVSK